MCYSKNVVFREDYRYDWAYYLSDKVIKSDDINIVASYTHSKVFKAFLCWQCNKVVGYDLDVCKNLPATDLLAVLSEKVDLAAIHRFNCMSILLCTQWGHTVFTVNTTEEQRCKM